MMIQAVLKEMVDALENKISEQEEKSVNDSTFVTPANSDIIIAMYTICSS